MICTQNSLELTIRWLHRPDGLILEKDPIGIWVEFPDVDGKQGSLLILSNFWHEGSNPAYHDNGQKNLYWLRLGLRAAGVEFTERHTHEIQPDDEIDMEDYETVEDPLDMKKEKTDG